MAPIIESIANLSYDAKCVSDDTVILPQLQSPEFKTNC